MGPRSSPFMLPSSSGNVSVSLSSIGAPISVTLASTVAYDPCHTTPQSCLPLETSWANPVYDPPPADSYTPGWVSNIAYHSRVPPHQESNQFSPPVGQMLFRPMLNPYLYSRDHPLAADSYYLDSSYEQYSGSQGQTYSIPSVSLPTSTYFQEHYSGPH
jgi:hypothetical protein